MAEASDFKFCMLLGYAIGHKKFTRKRKMGMTLD